MKKMIGVAAIIVLLAGLVAVPMVASAQEVSVGADIVSSYVWRGTKFGQGAAVQPTVEFSSGGFALGAWGSFGLAHDDAMEADLYAGYGFENGLYIGVTDYFFPAEDASVEYLDYDNHVFEANLGFGLGSLSFSGNMYFDSNTDNDTYVELAYDFGLASIFVGGGNESYTLDGDFAICNLGVSASKDIAVTDSFTLPLFGSVILNPDTEQMYIVVGMSF